MKKALLLFVVIFFAAGMLASVKSITLLENAQASVKAAEKALQDAGKISKQRESEYKAACAKKKISDIRFASSKDTAVHGTYAAFIRALDYEKTCKERLLAAQKALAEIKQKK